MCAWRRNRYLWILALALAVALSTAAAGPVRSPGRRRERVRRRARSRLGRLCRRHDGRPEPRQRLGPLPRARRVLVDCQRGHRDEHALRRNGAETGARGDRRRRPNRSCLQQHPGFVVTDGQASAPARFIYACEDGRIRGWAGSVPTDGSNATGDCGRQLSPRGPSIAGSPRLRRRTARRTSTRPTFINGRVDVFDANWRPIARKARSSIAGSPLVPTSSGSRRSASGSSSHTHRLRLQTATTLLPAGTWTSSTYEESCSRGLDGWARSTSRSTSRSRRLRSEVRRRSARRQLRETAASALYQERTRNHWAYRGALRTPDQQVLEVNGLWGLEFGNRASAGPREALYFTAGPHTWHDEDRGRSRRPLRHDHACGLGRAPMLRVR